MLVAGTQCKCSEQNKNGLPEALEEVNMPRSTLNCHVKKEPAFEKLHKTFT
jgi:hypothetical protein